MKYIPSKKQWDSWTLPSKASYLGVILAVLLFISGFIIDFYFEKLKLSSDHPKIVINSQNKPFLRYELKQKSKISFSYELSFKNKETILLSNSLFQN